MLYVLILDMEILFSGNNLTISHCLLKLVKSMKSSCETILHLLLSFSDKSEKQSVLIKAAVNVEWNLQNTLTVFPLQLNIKLIYIEAII